MSNLGMGVMLNMLGGNGESVDAFRSCVGKKITALLLDEEGNKLRFTFEDGSRLAMFDDGQSCCESRYMRTDDNLSDYIGGELLDAEVREAPSIKEEEYGDVHDVEFLVIKTSKGQFTMSNHNEHNGYYGGFSVRCEAEGRA